jgi:pyruvate ferredoxin oxidoreductase beta subunit
MCAIGISGARYIHIHVPCPLGWGSAPDATIKVARLAVESGLFPLIEAEHGEVTARYVLRKRVPVGEYLRLQRRFAHLFGKLHDEQTIAAIQDMADRNIRRFGLVVEG